MEVHNQIHPNDQQMNALLEPGHDNPIYMVNLLKFKEQAEYPDGRETELTGAQAFAIYGEAVAMYPNRKTLFDMLTSPEYQEVVAHRTAGLAGQLNIETTNPNGLWPLQQSAG